MDTAQGIYKRLINTETKTHYLILANLFELVFGRKLKNTEWGFLRKLIRIYGSEMVYWAILSSARAAGDTPLVYVASVCKGMLREAVTPTLDTTLETDTKKCLAELKKIKEEFACD